MLNTYVNVEIEYIPSDHTKLIVTSSTCEINNRLSITVNQLLVAGQLPRVAYE